MVILMVNSELKTFTLPFPNERGERKIWVYIPSHSEDEKLPVIYMTDGQNLFDQYTSFAGEWKVDETMNELSSSNKLNLIVVGIDNGGSLRTEEYTTWENKTYGGGDAEKYVEFVVNTLKPFVDSAFHTKPEKKFTGIMGSSLGGSVSHYAAVQFPDVFGKAGVFSPAFWFSDSCYQFTKDHANIKNQKMYFLAGNSESATMISDLEKIIKTMIENGYDSVGIQNKIVPGGKHNEQLWSNGFGNAVTWLFSDVLNSVQNQAFSKPTFKVFPNPAGKTIHIKTEFQLKYHVRIINLQGTVLQEKEAKGATNYDISKLTKGTYIVECAIDNLKFTEKFVKE